MGTPRDIPPWAVKRPVSLNLSRAARDRGDAVAAELGISRSALVDALLRAWSLEESRAAVRRVQHEDGLSYAGWKRGA